MDRKGRFSQEPWREGKGADALGGSRGAEKGKAKARRRANLFVGL